MNLSGAMLIASSVAGVEAQPSLPHAPPLLSWNDFLSYQLPNWVEEISRDPKYESNFAAFCWKNLHQCSKDRERLRQEFMRARILFDLLRRGGAWNYNYVLPPEQPKDINRPHQFLSQMAASLERDDGTSPLFQGDCDDIALLYAEVAAYLGLKSEVRLIYDNHVNVFVKVGDGELRVDLSGLFDWVYAPDPPWNLPPSDYVPEKGEPERYTKMLEPFNRYHRQGKPRDGNELAQLYLSPKAVERLYSRTRGEAPTVMTNELVQKWKPFMEGYRHARSCYSLFDKYKFPTVDAAHAASQKPGYNASWQADVQRYFVCLEDSGTGGLDNLGRALGHYLLVKCNPLPRSSPPSPIIGFIECIAVVGPLEDPIVDWMEKYHITAAGEPVQRVSEKSDLKAKLSVLSQFDPTKMAYPVNNDLPTWLDWLHEKQRQHFQLVSAWIYLAHTLETHPDWLPNETTAINSGRKKQ